jgi:hypothetical protein
MPVGSGDVEAKSVIAALNFTSEQVVAVNLGPIIHEVVKMLDKLTAAVVPPPSVLLSQFEVVPTGITGPSASLQFGKTVVKFAPVKPVLFVARQSAAF